MTTGDQQISQQSVHHCFPGCKHAATCGAGPSSCRGQAHGRWHPGGQQTPQGDPSKARRLTSDVMRAGLLTIRALPGLPMPAGLRVVLLCGRLLVRSLGLVEARVLTFRACRALPGLAGAMLLTGTPARRPYFCFAVFLAVCSSLCSGKALLISGRMSVRTGSRR